MNPVDKLSFDILGEVFSHYVEEETIFFPLETLLLVSQSWSRAALGHRALWGRLKIYLGHKPTTSIWNTRLPLRLERAGPYTPLEIDLRSAFVDHRDDYVMNHPVYLYECFVAPSMTWGACGCRDLVAECAHNSLHMLAGPNGQLCKRWTKLHLYIGDYVFSQPYHFNLLDNLSHPTPLLRSLFMMEVRQGKSFEKTLFPFTPALQKFSYSACDLRSLPVLTVARKVNIDLGFMEVVDFPDISNLAHAVHLEKLIVDMGRSVYIRYNPFRDEGWKLELPTNLSRLKSLTLHGGRIPTNLRHIQAPLLTHLEFEFDNPLLLKHVLTCHNLPWSQINSLTLSWDHLESGNLGEFYSAMKDLVQTATNVIHIKGDHGALGLLLKIFWEQCSEDMREVEREVQKPITIQFEGFPAEINSDPHTILIGGLSCRRHIEELALLLEQVDPSLDWPHSEQMFYTQYRKAR